MLARCLSIASILIISSWIPVPLAYAGNENGLLETEISNLDEQLQVLSEAKAIEGRAIGAVAAPNPAYEPIHRAFHQAIATGSKADLANIKNKMAKASPAGRIYLAAVFQRLDKIEGDRLLNSMLSDLDSVTERSGCAMATFSVSYFAQELLRQGSVAIALP